MKTMKLLFQRNLPLVVKSDGWWILDTGSPITISRDGKGPEGFGEKPAFRHGPRFDLDEIGRKLAGLKDTSIIRGLIGMDLLDGKVIQVDWDNGELKFPTYVVHDLDGPDWVEFSNHKALGLVPTGLRTVKAWIGGLENNALIDTGAQISYLNHRPTAVHPCGKVWDYMPGKGSWETDLFQIGTRVAGNDLMVKYGVTQVGFEAILGADLFRQRKVTLDYNLNRMLVQDYE
jgi:hypothetical protein